MTQAQNFGDLRLSMNRQPNDVRSIASCDRDNLIISLRKVDDAWVVASRYGEDLWIPTGGTSNTPFSHTKLDFCTIPDPFRANVKAMLYRYMRRGRQTQKPPGARQLHHTLNGMHSFIRYVYDLKVMRLSDVTPAICCAYVEACKERQANRGNPNSQTSLKKNRLASVSLFNLFRVVEAIYEFSQYTDDPMLNPPWRDTSAARLSGVDSQLNRGNGGKTPLMPDKIFMTLFQRAWTIVQDADHLLVLRDQIEAVLSMGDKIGATALYWRKTRALEELGWIGGLRALMRSLMDLRTSCYIVIASLSGCRNHEIAYLGANACYKTEDENGEVYWWMRSKSTKTDAGQTEWMIPEAAVTAFKVMERWAAPYQSLLLEEIKRRRATNPTDLAIAEAQEHLGAVFVGKESGEMGQVRTLSVASWNPTLKAFARSCGLEWNLTSHQFRRKFANYAARSQFGDLRYLREHFKHWSQDMTLGYALNESQEMSLYAEIQDELDDIKEGVAELWLNPAEPLAGGYGGNIVNWRSREESITLFKDRKQMVRSIAQSTAIRSNGHAWCTADDNLCVGNDLERTRCGDGCANAVIGLRHAPLYQRLYDDLKELSACEDIGEGGRARVQRDLQRCRSVLFTLGHDPEGVGG